jgi:hypothetical protein
MVELEKDGMLSKNEEPKAEFSGENFFEDRKEKITKKSS